MTLTVTQQTMVGIIADFVRFCEREDEIDEPATLHKLTLRVARFLSLRNDEVYACLNTRARGEELSREEEEAEDRPLLRADVRPCTLCGYADHTAEGHMDYIAGVQRGADPDEMVDQEGS